MRNINYADISLLNIALFIWQLPQNIIAILIYVLLQRRPIEYTNEHTGMTVLWIPVNGTTCWSLGQFIFAYPDASEQVLKHETGHCLQSLYLGPLYLLAVAIPSVCLFWWRRWFKKSPQWYKSHYPESWADKLGGVEK
jgi:hypothetical protein